MNRCLGTTRSGRHCGFRVTDGSDFCLNHDPGADTHAAATRASQAAARARAIQQTPSPRLMELMFALHNREAIQSTLDSIIRLTVADRIDKETASILVRACSVAARNFDRTPDLLSGPKKQQHDPVRYLRRVGAMLETVDPVLRELLVPAVDDGVGGTGDDLESDREKER